MSFFDDAITTLGRGLAQTAVGAISDETGYDVGGTLNALFGNGQTYAGENLANLSSAVNSSNLPGSDNTEIQNYITQQTDMIAGLGIQLSGLANQISGLEKTLSNIQELLQKINQQNLYTQWEIVDTTLVNGTSVLTTSYNQYSSYLANGCGPDNPSGPVATLCTEILDPDGGAVQICNLISTAISDDGERKGVLQLWSNMVVPLVSNGIIDYRQAVDGYFSYYQRLAYAELQATNLVMEAYNFKQTPKLASQAWADYRQYLLSQEQAFIQWLVPIIAAGVRVTDGPSPWYPILTHLASLELNPMYPSFYQSWREPIYYQPSALFKRAEQILADLYLTEADDRRVVVHMLYDHLFQSLVGAASISITSSDGGSEGAVSPSVTNVMPVYDLLAGQEGGRVPDETFCSNQFVLQRYVFTASGSQSDDTGSDPSFADGNYTITNINGQSGLVPINTYVSNGVIGGKFPFCPTAQLNYVIPISPETPFGFVNFVAYSST